MFERLAVSALTLVVAATPLSSQQHQHRGPDSTSAAMPQMQMQEMMGMGMGMMSIMGNGFMMRVMRYSPANVLDHADQLGLDDQQLSELVDLSAPARPMSQRMERRKQRMPDLEAAFDTNDPVAIAAAVEHAGAMHATMMTYHFTAAATVRSLLIPAQREQLMLLPAPHMGGDMMMTGRSSSEAGPRHNTDNR